MKHKIILLFIIACTYSCTSKSQSNIVTTGGDDAEMNAAIEKAKDSFTVFTAAFNSKKSKYTSFTIKVPFTTTEGNEHIWIGEISKKKDDYFGIVDNLPESTSEVKLGDKVKIDPAKISDWMFVEDGKLRGGYTIRLIRKRMTEEERKTFDTDLPFVIED
jgi:Uncharacterized protein conserved in bacteria